MELDRFNNFSNILSEKKKSKSKKKDKKEKKNDFISEKISKLMDEGYPHNQAVAIAMSYADKKALLESNKSEDATTININKKLLVDIIYKFIMVDKKIEKKVLDKIDKDNSIDTKDKIYPFLQSLDITVLENIILDITV